jgi:membrane protease YdiL (CAAX protease family)
MNHPTIIKQKGISDILTLSLWHSVVLFGIPSLVFAITIYILLPALDRAGVPIFLNFLISLCGPMALLIAASVIAYRHERQPWTWNAFRARFRLGPMNLSAWLWAVGLSVFIVLSSGFLSFTTDAMKEFAPIPEALLRMQDIRPNVFMGLPLSGAWWALTGYLLYILLNVAGEELWWRGYILPQQELAFGKWIWLVHGLLWNLFHSFFYWEMIMLLPGCLALAYVAQKCKSTWPGMIAHFVYNLPGLIFIIIGIVHG